jgi:hypothetical protein
VHAGQAGGPGEPADALGRVPVPAPGRLAMDAIDPVTPMILGVDLGNQPGSLDIVTLARRLLTFHPGVVTRT